MKICVNNKGFIHFVVVNRVSNCCLMLFLSFADFAPMFWNIHNYYSQFIQSVNNVILTSKSRIEKDLKVSQVVFELIF